MRRWGGDRRRGRRGSIGRRERCGLGLGARWVFRRRGRARGRSVVVVVVGLGLDSETDSETDSESRLRKPTPKADSESRLRNRLRKPTPKADSETDSETDSESRLRSRLRNDSETTPQPSPSVTPTSDATERSSASRATPRSRTLLPAPGAKKPRQLRGFAAIGRETPARFCRRRGACKRVRLRGFWRSRWRFWRLRLCGLWSRWCDGTTEIWGSRCGGRRARLRSMSLRGTAVRGAIALRGFRTLRGRRARCAGRSGWRWRGGTCRKTRLRGARSFSIAWRRFCTGWGRGG